LLRVGLALYIWLLLVTTPSTHQISFRWRLDNEICRVGMADVVEEGRMGNKETLG